MDFCSSNTLKNECEDKNEMSENANENQNDDQISKKDLKRKFIGGILSISLSITGCIIYDQYKVFKNDFATLMELPSKINDIESDFKDLNLLVHNLHSIENDILSSTKNDKQQNLSKNLEFTEIGKSIITIENSYFLAEPNWKDNDIIAKDLDTGKKLTTKQLINQKLLIPYTNSDNTINYFYGQYNENKHWDGNCIINVYNSQNNNLIAILDAKYDDGTLLTYKQIEQGSSNDYYTWTVSKRKNESDYKSGESIDYIYIEYKKKFEENNITVKDVLSATKFEKILKKDSCLESYYYGNTFDGVYNDDTGKAYYVKYSNKGKVETLYIGNFKNGKFNDDTGKAKEIVYDASYNMNKYFYYKGTFKEGIRQGKVDASNYITQEKIEKLLEGIEFNCELNWYDTE